MTSPQPDGEPTLRDVLDAIGAVARVQGEQGQAIAALTSGQSTLKADLSALAERVDAGFLDMAAGFELAESRHTETTQALEAIAGLVHEQQHAMVRSEARIMSRIEDVQGVVQSLKADLAAHVSDSQLHRDSHGQAA